MKRYKKNKYFFRTLNTILSGFLAPELDVNIIVNVITLELKNLRKQHKYYLKFVNALLLKFFKIFKYKHKLIGFLFSVKGRLILYNRETRRSVKFITRYGSIYKANMGVQLLGHQNKTGARYGAMYVSLYLSLYGMKQEQISNCNGYAAHNHAITAAKSVFMKNSKYDLFFDANYLKRTGKNTIFFFRQYLYNNKGENKNIFFYLLNQCFTGNIHISYSYVKYFSAK
jgi:hypothetical protein